jgi:3-oxoacyl-[acyl-carrier protein] reductase
MDGGGTQVKVALVTGASRGIGRACALALGEAGWSVAVGHRDSESEAKTTAEAVEAAGGDALVVQLDVSEEASVVEAFRRIEAELGAVAGLVNNAGTRHDGLSVKYSTDLWEKTLSTNLTGPFLCSRQALRGMLRAHWGRIVNISSAAALRGNPGQAAYISSKAGIVGLTRALAIEVGSRGVTVNAICPGLVDTELVADLTDDARRILIEHTPLGRAARPEEISSVVRFLMSEEASYMNGAVVAVDGGITA